MWGVESNDAICLKAAHAAACGSPDEPAQRAQTIIDNAGTHSNKAVVSSSHLILPPTVHVTSQPVPQFDPVSGKVVNPGGTVSGTVSVVTEVEVRPFILRKFFQSGHRFTFQSKHTIPITYVVPPDIPPANDESQQEPDPDDQD